MLANVICLCIFSRLLLYSWYQPGKKGVKEKEEKYAANIGAHENTKYKETSGHPVERMTSY
jgi:hypothetical protein